MERKQEGGSVSFDATDELFLAEHRINRILDTYNPANPETRAMLVDVVSGYGKSIDTAWSKEYSEAMYQLAQSGTNNMLAAALAGVEMGEKEREHNRNISDGV